MRIYLPRRLVKAWKPVGNWLNAEAYGQARRIDFLIVLLGVSLTAWWAWAYGWLWGLIAALLYTLGVMIGLWFL